MLGKMFLFFLFVFLLFVAPWPQIASSPLCPVCTKGMICLPCLKGDLTWKPSLFSQYADTLTRPPDASQKIFK